MRIRPVFRTVPDQPGIATVQVDRVVTSDTPATKRHDPNHPLADKNGDVWEAGVDTSAELVDMVEASRQYQNNVQVMQTAKSPHARNDKARQMTVTSDIYSQAGLSAPQTAAAKETGVQTIDQAGFLKLMTTQLQYQDPFTPMDNNQMVQQMATFTSLENQNSGNKLLQGISGLADRHASPTRRAGSARRCWSRATLRRPTARALMPANSRSARTRRASGSILVDGSGNVVKSLDLGAQKAGAVGFFWDGKNDAGEFVGNQPLKVQVRGGQTDPDRHLGQHRRGPVAR